jgi:hypothetical protein
MHQISIVKTPEGEEYLHDSWDTESAVEAFGPNLEILHLRAYPKD